MDTDLNALENIEELELNETISVSSENNSMKVLTGIHTVLSVLCFLIFVIFIYRYLKICFKRRRG